MTARLATAWCLAAAMLLCGTAGLLLVWLAWHARHLPNGLTLPFAGPATLGFGGVAVLAWRLRQLRSVPLSLHFSGGRWHCMRDAVVPTAPGATTAGRLALMLDLGDALLLRWRPDHADGGPTRWLGLTRRSVGPAGWHGLRVALQWPSAPGPFEAGSA